MKGRVLILLLFALGCSASTLTTGMVEGNLEPVTPAGWTVGRATPDSYQIYLDSANRHDGNSSVVMLSTRATTTQFGSLSQTIAVGEYAGKRVRFSGYLKSKLVSEWAGLWFRVDARTRQSVAFDNMEDRPIEGTTDWTRCDIVLDVPENAALMKFGLLLTGTGQVWLDECSLEVVGDDVKTTGMWVKGFDKEPDPRGYDTTPNNMSFEG